MKKLSINLETYKYEKCPSIFSVVFFLPYKACLVVHLTLSEICSLKAECIQSPNSYSEATVEWIKLRTAMDVINNQHSFSLFTYFIPSFMHRDAGIKMQSLKKITIDTWVVKSDRNGGFNTYVCPPFFPCPLPFFLLLKILCFYMVSDPVFGASACSSKQNKTLLKIILIL